MTADICTNRHLGNEESVAAFDRMAASLSTARSKVLSAIAHAGTYGITAKELASSWNVGLNCISGRFSELKKASLILKVGVRESSGIYIASANGRGAL